MLIPDALCSRCFGSLRISDVAQRGQLTADHGRARVKPENAAYAARGSLVLVYSQGALESGMYMYGVPDA